MTVRLLRLNVRCPECGAPPKLRTLPEMPDILNGTSPEQIILSYECHIRSCGHRYEIRVKHFTEAA